MSLVTPHASPTSSIEVAANPERAKAAAAPWRIDACRSSRRSNRRAGTSTIAPLLAGVHRGVYSWAEPSTGGTDDRSLTTDQVTFTEAELLADHTMAEPLIAGGVRCHGGFDDEGTYVSPRTKFRVPAIEAWQAQHTALFGQEMLDIPLETWPVHMPNVAQARHLIKAGVPEPLIATLTRIGTVEGYGANIRLLQPGDMQEHFQEDIRGTAIDHLGKGLFEAHGRDEAGWEEEAGHKDMWFAARDVAFENPTAKIDIDAMLARMGFGQQGGPGGADVERALPDDIDLNLELIANLMIRVLLIEIQAFHTFAWAEAWMADRDLVGGDGQAADLVAYIRADETPTWSTSRPPSPRCATAPGSGASGKTYAGTDMIGTLWTRGLEQSLGAGRLQTRKAVLGEVEHWCLQRDRGADILAEFHSLATPPTPPPPEGLGPERAAGSRLRGPAQLSIGGGAAGSGAVLTRSTRPKGPSIDSVWAVSSKGHMPASDWTTRCSCSISSGVPARRVVARGPKVR